VGSFAGVREEYQASTGFFGANLPAGTNTAFRRLCVRLAGLTKWVRPLSGFRRPPAQPADVGEQASLLGYATPAPLGGLVPGAEISLGFSLNHRARVQEHTFREEAVLTLACEQARPETELTAQFVYPLRNLVTFLFDQAQQVEGVSLWQQEIFAAPEDDPEVQVIRALIQPQEDAEADENSGRLYELFSITEVVPRFAQFISDWLRISETFSAACNLFFGLKYRPPGFVDLTFVVVVQTLLLYYTRREDGRAERTAEAERLERAVAALSEEQGCWLRAHLGSRPFPPFPHVLDKLLREHDEAVGPLIRGERAAFAAEVIRTLDYLEKRDREPGTTVRLGPSLFWMTEKLRFLMRACLLRELGFSPEKVRAFFEGNRLYQHIRDETAQ
jgi:hypothetical protein